MDPLSAVDPPPAPPPAPDVPPPPDALLPQIAAQLREHTGFDAAHYKPGTFARQVARRMSQLGLAPADYLQRLRLDAAEAGQLRRALLVSVTRFFRDAAVFERLGPLIAELAARRRPERPLRLWVPGCATGEEAWSLAILACEALGGLGPTTPLRIFATDLDADALRLARQGRYPRAAVDALPPALRERYFITEAETVRVVPALRHLCVFAVHDLLSQPPFLHLDLVSCRNVLIYLQPAVQTEILRRFHRALDVRGWLLLGQSESVSGLEAGFVADAGPWKLYRRHAAGAEGPPPAWTADHEAPALPPAWQGARRPVAAGSPADPLGERFHQALLQRHAPPGLFIDAAGQVRHSWGRVGPWLQLAGGPVDTRLERLCHPALREDVRALWHLARIRPPGELLRRRVEPAPGSPDAPPAVELQAEAVAGGPGEPAGVLLCFVAEAAAPAVDRTRAVAAPASATDTTDDDPLAPWRDELALAREQARTLVDELDRALDERQALDEELQASSEELQSSNEELQASNEELSTLNEQLRSRGQELGALNDMLLSIEHSIGLAIVAVDPQMRVLRFNPMAVRIFGLLPHDIGRPLPGVPCSLPLGDLPALIGRVLRDGQPLQQRIDHESRHYDLTLSPLLDMRQQLGGVILTFADKAELRAAEAEAWQLAAIVRHSEDAIIGADPQGRVSSWNPGAQALTGWPAEDMLGQPLLRLLPADRPAQRERLQDHLASGEAMPAVDTLLQRRDGSRIHASLSLSPVRDAAGTLRGLSLIARDVSARVADEAVRSASLARLEELVAERTRALADKERQLQTILEGMPGLVAYWDADLVLRYANHEHRTRLIHNGADGGVGLDMETVIGPERMAFVRPHVERVLSGQATRYEVGPVTAPGRAGDSWFMVHYVPDLREGTVVGFIAMGFDITEVKQAQTAAADASRAKSEFLASMSHEIRTPLNAVLGLAQVGARRCAGQAPAPVFEQILQSGQHLLSLIDHILDFSKIEAGKVELQQVPVGLDALVERALGVVRPLAVAQGLRLNVARDPVLAPAYLGDPVRLAQILINLLTNAVKFTVRGRVDLLLSARGGGGLVLSVTDTGAGMTSEVVARLFEPFERGDGSITRRVGGTGLGLSITRRLVDMMGGLIRVHSTPGQGSRFEVSLPLTAVRAEQLPADLDARWLAWPLATPLAGPLADARTAGARADDPARLGGVRVLVAEDHPVNRMVLAHVLEQEGARMVAVDNGLAAVEAVRRTPAAFDIVLCDIEMPGLDGYETTTRIHALAAGLPVIGLTAHAFDAARRRGREAGMADYVTKPYLVDVLVQAIVRQLPTGRRTPADTPTGTGAGTGAAGVVPTAADEIHEIHERHETQEADAATTAAPSGTAEPPRADGPNPYPPPEADTPVAATAPADTGDDPWRIDGDALLAHYRVGPDFLPRLLGRVRDSLAQEPERLQAAWDAGDLATLRGLAHGIVGMAAHLLLPALQARARALELALQAPPAASPAGDAGGPGADPGAESPQPGVEARLRALLQALQAVQQRLPAP